MKNKTSVLLVLLALCCVPSVFSQSLEKEKYWNIAGGIIGADAALNDVYLLSLPEKSKTGASISFANGKFHCSSAPPCGFGCFASCTGSYLVDGDSVEIIPEKIIREGTCAEMDTSHDSYAKERYYIYKASKKEIYLVRLLGEEAKDTERAKEAVLLFSFIKEAPSNAYGASATFTFSSQTPPTECLAQIAKEKLHLTTFDILSQGNSYNSYHLIKDMEKQTYHYLISKTFDKPTYHYYSQEDFDKIVAKEAHYKALRKK